MSNLTLTVDEALSVLKVDKNDNVSNVTITENGTALAYRIISREEAESIIRSAHKLEIGDEGARALQHQLVVWPNETSYLLYATDILTIRALQEAKTA